MSTQLSLEFDQEKSRLMKSILTASNQRAIINSTVKSFSRENRHTSPAFATKNKNLVWFISLN
ncbi:unnamed protein product [marine sediment metagenome]|uniref:Uncharacterized protein n=1 Tax=marine sediment metagenome TaxID=412755 RepID=X1EKJ2_9ZZZZ